MVYPQMAGLEYFEPSRHVRGRTQREKGMSSRVGRWLKESF